MHEDACFDGMGSTNDALEIISPQVIILKSGSKSAENSKEKNKRTPLW